MKKLYWLILAALLTGLLAGCAQEATEPGNVLLVTDGTSEQSYSVDDLKALGAEEAAFREVTYTGVPLALLLKDAGFDPASVAAVKATAADGFSANYDPELVNRPDTLVAYAQADGPLAEEDGTFRMVLPDQEGKLNPRNIVELRVYP
jgi:DMSO/TMAO reductase YedYZ molybdopterin-dependent catalytic subunit